MKPRRRASGRPALSSVYGFIMIYLLVIASLQAISVSLSSGQGADAAAQQAEQVTQMRSLERLEVRLGSDGNVTITNDGLITSDLSFILVQSPGGDSEVPVQGSLAVGSSLVVDDQAPSAATSVAVVTSLGNVFASSASGSGVIAGKTVKVLQNVVGGPDVDAQLYQNPSDPGRFFLAEGASAFAYSAATGGQLWSFDAGQGEVTDVLPLSDGGVYVSDGYYGDQFTSDLFQLTSSGSSVATYTMRLFRLYTTAEVLYENNGQPPYPYGSQPVQKGSDSLYAYYDGWILSSSGFASSVPADSDNLATSDATQFYVYTNTHNPSGPCDEPYGNQVDMSAYSATAQGVQEEWTTPVYLGECNEYSNYQVASTASSGLLVSLFSNAYWSQPTYYGGPYPGSNPFIAVFSASSGALLRNDTLDSNGYSSVATDGTEVYLSIPSTDQVEALPAAGTGKGTFYDIGIPATTLLWEDGSLFAISASQVEVYSPSMSLESSLDFSPMTFYSLSNSKPLETQMVQPSFLVLNSTSYLALVRNSTGYGTLVLGNYAG